MHVTLWHGIPMHVTRHMVSMHVTHHGIIPISVVLFIILVN